MASYAKFLSRNSIIEPYKMLPVVTDNHSFSNQRENTRTILQLIIVLTTILIATYSINLVMEFSVCPQQPIIHINSLFLSNFSVSETKVAAVWITNLTVFNPSVALQISVDGVESSMLYREDDSLAITSANGFRLGLRERKNVQMKFWTTGWEGDQPIVEYPVLRDMEGDRRRGTVPFSFRMTMWGTYSSGLLRWSRRVRVTSYCFGLDVAMVAGTEKGSLIEDGPTNCSVRMLLD